MTDLDAKSEAARALNRARWGSRVAVRAAQTVIERADELTEEQLAELAAALRLPAAEMDGAA